MSEVQKDFDILELPLEGVAAYWLSLKKLVGSKRNFKALEEEAQYTTEPFVRHLLDVGFCGYSDDRVRMLAHAKMETLLGETARRFNLMRVAILDVATGENPHRTLAKLLAQYPAPPISEDKAKALSQELLKLVPEHQAGQERFFDVGHKSLDDKLIVTLLFYVLLSRHESKSGCQPLLAYVSSRYFREGLSMVIDGFDAPFVRKWLKEHKAAVLSETRRKMLMSTEMCVAIGMRLEYEDVFRVARSYMR
ncbi:hypothetical protein N1030_08685 [Desulfovibrio mangrovi]|uniref:hypothetical protein n=1 Tax=Desulfovibrio mangrovi TaxID=2976983 RepID=UPI002246EF15|nr:hypothetical protein [Desulfovibrio mangrovi]UZP69026.1 hypothetical protein N1030_08685 [Desulfovibrio mangrovi]